MDFYGLLEIDKSFLKQPDDWGSMAIAYRSWLDLGCPTNQTGLIDVLERTIKTCIQGHVRYHRILLARLKQLKRGQWQPRFEGATPAGWIEGATPAVITASCPKCGNSGHKPLPGGIGMTLCDCGAWKRQEA